MTNKFKKKKLKILDKNRIYTKANKTSITHKTVNN